MYEGLVADGSAGGVGFFEEVVDEVFVEADGDAGFALRLRFWRGDSSALSFAEIVLAVSSVFLVLPTFARFGDAR